MNIEIKDINRITLTGRIISRDNEYEIKRADGEAVETFYRMLLNIKRLSDTKDNLPVIISSKFDSKEYKVGDYVTVNGIIKTRNYTDSEGKNHTSVFVYALDILCGDEVEKEDDQNSVELTGTICKKSDMRITASGRKITDIILAVHRTKNPRSKSDYIPCILWGKNAAEVAKLSIGTVISVIGRFQSRYYYKNDEEHVAYEVSTVSYSVADTDDTQNTKESE